MKVKSGITMLWRPCDVEDVASPLPLSEVCIKGGSKEAASQVHENKTTLQSLFPLSPSASHHLLNSPHITFLITPHQITQPDTAHLSRSLDLIY